MRETFRDTTLNQDLIEWCVNPAPIYFNFDVGATSWDGGAATRPQWGDPSKCQ